MIDLLFLIVTISPYIGIPIICTNLYKRQKIKKLYLTYIITFLFVLAWPFLLNITVIHYSDLPPNTEATMGDAMTAFFFVILIIVGIFSLLFQLILNAIKIGRPF